MTLENYIRLHYRSKAAFADAINILPQQLNRLLNRKDLEVIDGRMVKVMHNLPTPTDTIK